METSNVSLCQRSLVSEKRLRAAYDQLKKRGIPLASNQVNYSLIYRLPEENGVKSTCDELGISLIAYSPIAQGELLHVIGIYTSNNNDSCEKVYLFRNKSVVVYEISL